MKAIGYLRVSKEEENVENQKYEILNFAKSKNLEVIGFFSDEDVSGVIECFKRPGFKAMIDFLNINPDVKVIIFADVSRLGRNMEDTLNVIKYLIDRDYKVYFVKQDFLDGINDKNIQKLILSILSWFAEYERKMIVERTKIALKRLKEQGVKLGRPYKLSEKDIKDLIKLLNSGVPKTTISRILGVSYPTVYNYLKRIAKNEIRIK